MLNNMFPSTQQFTLAIFVSIANAFVLLGCSIRLLHIFQLGGYKPRNFLTWLFERKAKFYVRLFVLSVLSFGSMFVVNILFIKFPAVEYLSYLGMIFYFYFAFVFITGTQREPTKVSLKFTARIKRLVFVMAFVLFALSFVVVWLGSMNKYIRFSLIAAIPAVLPAVLLLCNYILWPYEAGVRAGFLARAQRKLRRPEYANLVRIGITGSWGKTSCKNILAKMLACKYNVAASPSSFNTPMGFTKTVNNVLECGHEVLIFEMGARYPGDIRYLCNLFRPTYGILTDIGPQHIETMHSIDVIKRTKADLLRALPRDGGVAITNGDSRECREVFAELDLKNKFLCSVDKVRDSDAWVEDLSATADGCVFKLCLKDSKAVECKTRLLGRHNIENILLCAIAANRLGVSVRDIAAAVRELEPIPHRLELIRAANGVLILDDSYNASVGGTAAALEVLSLFRGQKVVMTPGLVELGARAAEENFKFGMRIAKIADKVIIMGEVNRGAIRDGLHSKKFREENIFFAKNLDEAKGMYSVMLAPGDVLLIENDLPDNYL